MSILVRFHLPLALSRFHTAFVKGMPFWRMSWTHASTCPHLCVSSRSNCNKCRRWIRWRYL